MPPASDKDVLNKVKDWFATDKKAHSSFLDRVKRGYDVYDGILDPRSSAATWTHKITPRYAFEVLETLKAGMLDPNPKVRLRPRPRVDSPEVLAMYRAGVKANEILLNDQMDDDRFIEKQGPYALQALIAGLTVGKCYWDYREGPRTRQRVVMQQGEDPYTGMPTAPTPALERQTRHEVEYARPTFEVVDVQDFIWHQAAVSLDRALRVHHRCYYSFDELKAMEAQGLFKNVDELKETSATPNPGNADSLFRPNKAKDMVEVVETWYRAEDGIHVAVVGNDKVLLQNRESPFDHGQYPFIVASTQPGLFRVTGTGEADLMEEIERAIWSFLNQSLDGLALMNNPVLFVGPEVEDIDDLQFFPGAVNQIQSPQSVQWMRPEANIPQMALPWLERLKQDLQNTPGASTAVLGQPSQMTQTATEVSSLTTMALRRVQAKKAQIQLSYKRKGELDIELNQQFMEDDQVVTIVGPGDQLTAHTISPLDIQGRYGIDVAPMDESMIKNERAAAASSRLQIAMAAAPIFAAMHQGAPNDVPMLNLPEFMNDVLEAGGIEDKERYYIHSQQAAQGVAGAPGQPGQPPMNGNGGAPGLTAPQAFDMNSPSHDVSQSPVNSMQQLMAMRGGPQNG